MTYGNALIYNCVVESGSINVLGHTVYLGGIAGRFSDATANSCLVDSAVDITGSGEVGGIVGDVSMSNNSATTNCIFQGSLEIVVNEYSGRTHTAGGIVGYMSSGYLYGCHNYGTVTVTTGTMYTRPTLYVGMIVGSTMHTSVQSNLGIHSCSYTESVLIDNCVTPPNGGDTVRFALCGYGYEG